MSKDSGNVRFVTGMVSLVALLVSGCAAVGPNYERPAVPMGTAWTQPAKTTVDEVVLSRWWQGFDDPQLDRLVEVALTRNLDVREAAATIAVACAQLALSDAAAAPSATFSGSASRQRVSANAPEYNPARSTNQTVGDLGFDASWEIDLFGSLRRANESAQAGFAATQADAAAVTASVAAEVARTYFIIRGTQRELAARASALVAMERQLELGRGRLASGDLAVADVDRIQAERDLAATALPGLRARLHAASLGLGALTGGLPESQLAIADNIGTEWTLPAEIPVGERADVLRRRPDVMSAEHRLAAATADIGVATAEWFPKLTLSASSGFRSIGLGNVLEGTSRRGSVGPLISWRLLDGGRIRAEINAAESEQQVAALAYEKTVLGAITDAERALSNYRLGLDAVRAQADALASLQQSHRNTAKRYELGDIALRDLLDSERDLRDQEAVLAQTRTSATQELVALFKALGGGWSERARSAIGAKDGDSQRVSLINAKSW